MKYRASCALLLSSLAVLAACETPATPPRIEDPVRPDSIIPVVRDTSALIQTGELRYEIVPTSMGRGADIPFVYHNTLSDTLYIVNCRGEVKPYVERLLDGKWKPVWYPVYLLCLSDPVKIAPGASYSGVLQFGGFPAGSNSNPELPAGDLNGTYRLGLSSVVFHNPPRSTGGDSVQYRFRVSNAFSLVAH
jgi:hypothetical protein